VILLSLLLNCQKSQKQNQKEKKKAKCGGVVVLACIPRTLEAEALRFL